MMTATGSAVVFGAGGGIGRAVVHAIAARRAGAAVYAGTRQGEDLAQNGAIPFAFDLNDEGSIAAAAATFVPAPDLVIVATGVLHDAARGLAPEKSLRMLDSAAMAQLFAINTIGPALIAKHVLPRLRRDHRTVFVVLSARVGSIADNRLGGWHGYRASKAALNMLIRNFAIELARSHPHAVIVSLHPGTVDSALSAPFQRGVTPGRLFTPDQCANHLLDVIDHLTPADSGHLYAWDGQRLPF
jgi:NAD(P)-dependent dehydrogenase (short-subunit alcohol dehydrogenase family)